MTTTYMVARTGNSRSAHEIVLYTKDYPKYSAEPTEFTNKADAEKIAKTMQEGETRGRTWMVLTVETV